MWQPWKPSDFYFEFKNAVSCWVVFYFLGFFYFITIVHLTEPHTINSNIWHSAWAEIILMLQGSPKFQHVPFLLSCIEEHKSDSEDDRYIFLLCVHGLQQTYAAECLGSKT